MADQSPDIEWHGDVPVATQFDDPYFSLHDGLAESRHVFLGGNDLPARFREGFHIAELGFGTGLNAAAALAAWREAGVPGPLRFTSFERFPMGEADRKRALAVYPHLPVLSADDLDLEIVIGDVRETLPSWKGQADAWFLDGFSPAKNPAMWGVEVIANVARCTATAGTAATYSAAGHVRRALSDAGFVVDRITGFGRKRHMTIARLP
ncbi:MAG: tRNA (5-methylaminomethyl-2-thiouridine)(34)-methyltransferase MnmD [Pseudomonadota bacterium]